MTKSVAILGCGPAGLMAAHAAALSGWDFRIYSRRVPSKLYGAQYLHQPIPALECGVPRMIQYYMRGTPEQYRRKVYGDDWDGTVSPEDFPEPHAAWDIRTAYEHLWRVYSDEIIDVDFREKLLANLVHSFTVNTQTPDLIVSTVPRKIWAEPGDVFESTYVWALGDTELPRVEKPYRPEPFTVQCDGRPHVPWYRVSNIYGYCTIEWPYDPSPQAIAPHDGASIVEKPLRHNSTAASDFVHLGRYGAWQKGVLSHDAFFEAMKVLAGDAIR